MDNLPFSPVLTKSFLDSEKIVIATTLEASKIPLELKNLLEERTEFLIEIVHPLFWLVYFILFDPRREREIKALTRKSGRIFATFCLTCQDLSNYLAKCFPYVATQALQHLFILISRGNPQTVEKDFRMKVATTLVKLFTGVSPIDTLISERLGKLFPKPPIYDIPEPDPPANSSEIQTSLLPIEDLNSLIDLERRKRPELRTFRVASLSPIVSAAINRDLLENEQDARIDIAYPKGGTKDWTTDLPELMPEVDTALVEGQKYDLSSETKSLIHRSRRPNTVSEYFSQKAAHRGAKHERQKKAEKIISTYERKMAAIDECPPKILTKFVKDLRQLQLEKKRDETPDFADGWGASRDDELQKQDLLAVTQKQIAKQASRIGIRRQQSSLLTAKRTSIADFPEAAQIPVLPHLVLSELHAMGSKSDILL